MGDRQRAAAPREHSSAILIFLVIDKQADEIGQTIKVEDFQAAGTEYQNASTLQFAKAPAYRLSREA